MKEDFIVKAVVFTTISSSGLMILEKQADQKAWNNGYCTCGTKWTLKNVEHIRNGGNRYYWYCKNCGENIILRYDYTKKNQK